MTLPSDKTIRRDVPCRVFVDSSVLQNLWKYGEFVYDGGEIEQEASIWSVPDGPRNMEALRNIMLVAQRWPVELAVSLATLEEVAAYGTPRYVDWAFEVLHYWNGCQDAYGERSPFSGRGTAVGARIATREFGYLAEQDRKLMQDALQLECDAFLTMDRKLARNGAHLERNLGIWVAEPFAFWTVLRPLAPLFL